MDIVQNIYENRKFVYKVLVHNTEAAQTETNGYSPVLDICCPESTEELSLYVNNIVDAVFE